MPKTATTSVAASNRLIWSYYLGWSDHATVVLISTDPPDRDHGFHREPGKVRFESLAALGATETKLRDTTRKIIARLEERVGAHGFTLEGNVLVFRPTDTDDYLEAVEIVVGLTLARNGYASRRLSQEVKSEGGALSRLRRQAEPPTELVHSGGIAAPPTRRPVTTTAEPSATATAAKPTRPTRRPERRAASERS